MLYFCVLKYRERRRNRILDSRTLRTLHLQENPPAYLRVYVYA